MQDTLFLLATGALAGAAAGAWLGRRYGSLGAFVDDMKVRLRDAKEFWSAEDELEASDEDDDALEAYREGHGLPDEEDDEQDDEEGRYVEATDVGPADTLPAPHEAHAADLPSNRPDERTLEARVLDRFEDDEVLQQRAVDIAAVGDGVIELSGWVHSGDEAARAAALARAVQGVTMVLNRITIRGPGTLEDGALSREATPTERPGPAPESRA